ncbi:KGGVGR-motif variant AAA ATPase [Saccharopolyspora sp. NPDC003752]
MTRIRFDKAWENACEVADGASRAGIDVILVRDLVGRLSLILDDMQDIAVPDGLAADFGRAAGPFCAATPIHRASEMFAATALLNSPDLLIQHESDPVKGRGRFAVLERTAVGADWVRASVSPPEHRATLYGFKGGVGRSTATFMLAKHLADRGFCVLVADLDLESPGIGELLQHTAALPKHGLVDYLVEAAVGNEAGLDLVSRSEVIKSPGNGEVWLLPADGAPLHSSVSDESSPTKRDYLAKLNRVYTEVPGGPDGPRTLADRLEQALGEAERQVAERSRKPDVTLLDSRAGIHDIAAIAITRLSGFSFLFATDNPHTWAGYRTLFGQWRQLPPDRLGKLRQRLRMVASLVPDSDSEQYVRNFRDNAQQCFADMLYDDEKSPADLDAFNFSPEDEDAPHSPLPILFHGGLVGLNHVAMPDWYSSHFLREAYDQFLTTAAALIIEENS